MSPLTMQGSAEKIGAWVRLELSLYEVVGAWVATTTEPSAKIFFDAASQHHAWRAAGLQGRLPAGLPRQGPPSPDAGRALDELAVTEGAVERLAAYCRAVLPRIVTGYGEWRRLCSRSSDRAVARTIERVLPDVLADWQEGLAVLLGLLGDEAAVAAASASLGRVETALVVGTGLVPDGH